MRINPISCQTNLMTQRKLRRASLGVSAPERQNVSFQGKPLTKFLGGLSGLTSIIAVIGTGGAAIIPAIFYTAVTTGIGYCMDKENEKDDDDSKK